MFTSCDVKTEAIIPGSLIIWSAGLNSIKPAKGEPAIPNGKKPIGWFGVNTTTVLNPPF